MPLVSVLITSYNRENYISESIESVISSDFHDFELIIVDDCSTDRTVEIAKKYAEKDRRVKVYQNDINLGDYPNRNKAASYANGKYIKYLDSDDLFYNYSLKVMVDFMENNPIVGFAVSSNTNSTIQKFPIILKPSQSIRQHFLNKNFLDCAPTGTIIKREVFESLNGFSGKRMIGDIEFALKCAANYNVMILPPGLVFWREHGNQEVFYGIKNGFYEYNLNELYINFFNSISDDLMSSQEKLTFMKERKKEIQKAKIKKIINRIFQ
jgi:glycosyltransferase involved in cell wall biosynthesis